MTDGTTTWNYTYDDNGMRTGRTNGTTTYNYVYNGSQLSQMTVGSNTLNFAYDAGGVPMMVAYNGTNYYYITNLQGDVMGIVDSTGTIVVNYTYDAWGKPLSVTGTMAATLGTLNPLRYRGYVYDTETGYYYLQSRYYDPEIGRFINADAFVATGQGMLGNNMFIYCGNNPVGREDPGGYAFVQAYFDPDGSIQMSGSYLWGGGSGGVAYAASAVSSFPKETVQKIWADVSELIDAGEDIIDLGISGYHLYQATKELKEALAYFTLPIPTPVDEAFGAGHALKALYHLYKYLIGVIA